MLKPLSNGCYLTGSFAGIPVMNNC